jgi:hypothetical protein
MVTDTRTPREPDCGTYVGGVRWRKLTNVSAPLAKFTIGSGGIAIRPSVSRFPQIWRFLGIPTLHWDWSLIDEVELVRGPFLLSHAEGVSFRAQGRRLVFGCDESSASEIFDYAAQRIPDKVVRRAKPKVIV